MDKVSSKWAATTSLTHLLIQHSQSYIFRTRVTDGLYETPLNLVIINYWAVHLRGSTSIV
jgi:hypothetical protein